MYPQEIGKEIKEETGRKEHMNLGMFVLVIMSHGTDQNPILDYKGKPVSLSHIRRLLSPRNFPAMAGKPKLVITISSRSRTYPTPATLSEVPLLAAPLSEVPLLAAPLSDVPPPPTALSDVPSPAAPLSEVPPPPTALSDVPSPPTVSSDTPPLSTISSDVLLQPAASTDVPLPNPSTLDEPSNFAKSSHSNNPATGRHGFPASSKEDTKRPAPSSPNFLHSADFLEVLASSECK